MAVEEKETRGRGRGYVTGRYWAKRSDMIYYRYVDYIMRVVAKDARSLIDVGTGNCPYLEWFDWIPDRVSIDLQTPYQSASVRGVEGNILEHRFEERFDVCTCLQVLEHVPQVSPFARRLQEIARTLVVSVPYHWPEGATRGHVQDPVTQEKLEDWMGRKPNYSMVVAEPFMRAKARRLIAVYDEDPERRFGWPEVRARVVRDAAV